MSDVMLFGVLRMPFDMAMADEMSRWQYWQRGQQAADELTRLRAENAELRAEREAMAKQGPVAYLKTSRISGERMLSFDDECRSQKLQPLFASTAPIPEGWQPIETAPKDGALFIGWERSEGFCVMRYGPSPGTSYIWESGEGYPRCPSHWMPLPAAPKP